MAKDIFAKMFATGKSPLKIVEGGEFSPSERCERDRDVCARGDCEKPEVGVRL